MFAGRTGTVVAGAHWLRAASRNGHRCPDRRGVRPRRGRHRTFLGPNHEPPAARRPPAARTSRPPRRSPAGTGAAAVVARLAASDSAGKEAWANVLRRPEEGETRFALQPGRDATCVLHTSQRGLRHNHGLPWSAPQCPGRAVCVTGRAGRGLRRGKAPPWPSATPAGARSVAPSRPACRASRRARGLRPRSLVACATACAGCRDLFTRIARRHLGFRAAYGRCPKAISDDRNGSRSRSSLDHEHVFAWACGQRH